MNRDCFVYRIYGGDELLYIGASCDVERRFKQHKHQRPEMFAKATRYETQGPYTRRTAHEVEFVAICQERPPFNTRCNPDKRVKGVPLDMDSEYIGSADACKLLGIDRSTFTRWVASERIKPVLKLDGRTGARLFYRADIEAVRDEGQVAS